MEKCVVIIPALNEEKTIGKVIDNIPKSLFDGNVIFDVLVVNDGSTDNTEKIAREHGADVINHNRSMGVGVSFSNGIRAALLRQADYAVNIDADGQMNPRDIVELLKPLYDNVADMVTAIANGRHRHYGTVTAFRIGIAIEIGRISNARIRLDETVVVILEFVTNRHVRSAWEGNVVVGDG